jgi:uroporphyrinogen decarboxylase
VSSMTPRQRLEKCLAGEKPDRTPVALWRHFPVDDQTPERLAAAALNFQRTFEFDLVKFTPASSFCIKDWGSQDEWRGATEGTRDYTNCVIQQPEDWTRLKVLDPTQGYLGAQLDSLGTLIKALGPDIPVIQTVFNPLSQAKNLVGKNQLLTHLRLYPDAVHEGLRTITETTSRYVDALADLDIAGIFYAVQHAQYGLLTEAEYQEFGEKYDRQVLQPAESFWLNMLHLHGLDVMFDLFRDYPIQVINWHDRETPPSLGEAKKRFDGILCGGLRREETIVLGTPEDVVAEGRDAIRATDGRRFILGTGCVTPITAPYGNLMAARRVVEQFEV